MSYGHGVALIGAEPRVAAVESAANVAGIVVEDCVLAIDSASELRRGNFDLGGLVARDAGIGDCNSPKQSRFEVAGRRNWVHVACFVAGLIGYPGVVGNHEGEGAGSAASGCDYGNRRADTLVRNKHDEVFGRNKLEGGVRDAQQNSRGVL